MAKQRTCATYLLASDNNRVIYAGVTGDLLSRKWTHRQGADRRSFAGFYRARKLVYFELHATMEAAIRREKVIKGWRRSKKVALIQKRNQPWRDLWPEVAGARDQTPSSS